MLTIFFVQDRNDLKEKPKIDIVEEVHHWIIIKKMSRNIFILLIISATLSVSFGQKLGESLANSTTDAKGTQHMLQFRD